MIEENLVGLLIKNLQLSGELVEENQKNFSRKQKKPFDWYLREKNRKMGEKIRFCR